MPPREIFLANWAAVALKNAAFAKGVTALQCDWMVHYHETNAAFNQSDQLLRAHHVLSNAVEIVLGEVFAASD